MSRSADLAALLKWQPRNSAQLPWDTVEERLGHALPSDYKDLVSTFGTGVFERAVGVISPADSEASLVFFREEMNRVLEIARNNEPLPHRLFPDRGGLVPWGEVGDGCTLFWRTDKGDPDQWTVIYCDAEFSEWEEFDGSASEFVFELISGRIESELIEYDPSDDPEFDPHPGDHSR